MKTTFGIISTMIICEFSKKVHKNEDDFRQQLDNDYLRGMYHEDKYI